MAFYLKAPRGMIDFHILQKCVEERMRFFKNMAFSSVSKYTMEYLLEDSALDRTGHFTLRLAAVKDPSFLSFFVSCELKLLKMRLDSYDGDSLSLRTFLKNQLRHARECAGGGGCSEKITAFLNAFVVVITRMVSRNYRSHVFAEAHVTSDQCKIFTLNVPFQHCVSLISRRSVNLRNGYAQISCEKWKDVLLSFFHTFLKTAISEMHYSKNVQIALEDQRIKSVLATVCVEEDEKINSSVSLAHIELETKFFPLCMQNLHGVLRKKHRLDHEERFNLSLFLKDIGVSLNDSVAYWKLEYSKDHEGCSKCSHSWQKDEKRYVYSIRHLYGLEGSRKIYKTRSCSHFQSMSLSSTQEGGCPFKHFDNEKLKHLISTQLVVEDDINSILSERGRSPSDACRLFLKSVNGSLSEINNSIGDSSSCSSDFDVSFNNPVQYFLLMKNIS